MNDFGYKLIWLNSLELKLFYQIIFIINRSLTFSVGKTQAFDKNSFVETKWV